MDWIVLVLGMILGVVVTLLVSRKGMKAARQPVLESEPDAPFVRPTTDDDALQSLHAPVLCVDTAHRITRLNTAARSMLRVNGDPLGDDLGTLLDARHLVNRVLPPSQITDAHGEIVLSENPLLVVQVGVARLRDDGGAVLVLHEVTEFKQLENMRRDFVANVSHELRTPVSVIQANAETLLNGALDDPVAAREFVSAMMRHGLRLSRLVSDLLDLARIESGAHNMVIQDVFLQATVSRAFESVAGRAEKKRTRLENQVAEDLVAAADQAACEQVLINLVENAIKYGPEESHVCVRTHTTPDAIRIEVVDEGPGIEASHRERLFERFYRVDAGRSRAEGGTGLCLSIVKHLVNAMHGDVGIEPRRPHGSVFWFTLQKRDGLRHGSETFAS